MTFDPRAFNALKSEDKYYEAGRYAFEHGKDKSYGPHFGFRSTYEFAVREFMRGFAEAKAEAEAEKK